MKNFKHTWLILFFLALNDFTCHAQNEYSVTNLPSALLVKADAILRLDEKVYDILSYSEAKVTHRKVITILNEAGEQSYGQQAMIYDKLTKLTEISGLVYDASGKVVKKIKKSEILDYSNSGNDITDDRVKVINFGKKNFSYPYTLEFYYETIDKNMMFYPAWRPLLGENLAVEKSIFVIKTPSDFHYRYQTYNGVNEVSITMDDKNRKVYTWSLEKHPAIKKEVYSQDYDLTYPLVLSAPTTFEIQGYKGNFTSWQDLSKFYYELNRNRDELPVQVKEELKSLVKDAKSDRDKIDLVYKWAQSRTRYYSIQLGIGGWQTIDATTVATKGYGDCKALSNFVVATLKEVGVTAYTALIFAGRDETINEQFPSSQFNHVIACAFTQKDTIWLECTSQTAVPNFMGSFTGNRKALLVMPENGTLVATPTYTSNSNQQTRFAEVSLNEDGSAKISSSIQYKGVLLETRKAVMESGSKEDQRKWLTQKIGLSGMDITSFEINQTSEIPLSIHEKIVMESKSYAGKTGSRLFLKLGLLSDMIAVPEKTDRKSDFELPVSAFAYSKSDSIVYHAPAGFIPETTLPEFSLSSNFGSYTMKCSLVDNHLVYLRTVTMEAGKYPANQYNEWLTFLTNIQKADRAQVVLVKK